MLDMLCNVILNYERSEEYICYTIIIYTDFVSRQIN